MECSPWNLWRFRVISSNGILNHFVHGRRMEQWTLRRPRAWKNSTNWRYWRDDWEFQSVLSHFCVFQIVPGCTFLQNTYQWPACHNYIHYGFEIAKLQNTTRFRALDSLFKTSGIQTSSYFCNLMQHDTNDLQQHLDATWRPHCWDWCSSPKE